MKIYFTLLLLISLWVVNCSAADNKQEKEIVIQKISDGVFLGILVSELDDKEKKDLKSDNGALVVNVIEESEADKAGIKEKDVIISFNGQEINTAKELNDLVEEIKEETAVKLTLLRDGIEQAIEATLKKSDKSSYKFSTSDDDGFSWHFSGDDDDFSWVSGEGDQNIIIKKLKDGLIEINGGAGKGGFLGVEVKGLSEQMREYFEVKFGVLIETVIEKSAAETAGLKAGDVITHIEGREIKDYGDLVRTVSYYNPEETIKIEFVRKGSQKSVKAKLAERKQQGIFINDDGDKTIIKESMGMPHNRIKKKHFMMKDFKESGKNILYII